MFLKKVKNRIFHRYLGRLFFQTNQDFYARPSIFKRWRRDINQAMNQKGWQTPLIFSREECASFWSSIDNKSGSTGNRPESYAQKSTAIIDFLNDFWTPEVSKEMSILELGCNCGTNLSGLQKLGYRHLGGIEINPNAVEQLRKTYPGLAQSAEIQTGNMETLLPQQKDRSVDVIFTMGVSMHIHPKNNFLFKEMMRVSKRYICTIEPEASNSNYVFARNYRRIFSSLGAHQVKSVLIYGSGFSRIPDYQGLTARLFRIPEELGR